MLTWGVTPCTIGCDTPPPAKGTAPRMTTCVGSKTGLHTFLSSREMVPYHEAMARNATTPEVVCPACSEKVPTFRDDTGVHVATHDENLRCGDCGGPMTRNRKGIARCVGGCEYHE